MHFIITTPVLDGARYIDETILSVVAQSGPFTIRYHIQDGGSKDDTLAKLVAWERRLANDFPILCQVIEFSFVSEPDRGLYDAVNRGFAATGDGDIMGWINSDDRIEQGAFASIVQTLAIFPDISWFCGRGAIMDENGALMKERSLIPYPRRAIAAGIFDGRFEESFIMQESVFWRSSLWQKVGGVNGKLKLAGDHQLWRDFAEHADLVVVDGIVGYFRSRAGQLSENLGNYRDEIDASLSRALRRRRLLQSLFYKFGFIKFHVVTQFLERDRSYRRERRYKKGLEYKVIRALKIGRFVIHYRTQRCRRKPETGLAMVVDGPINNRVTPL